MIVLGVDPGVRGALAWVDGGGTLLSVADMPTVTLMINGKQRLHVDPMAVGKLLRETPATHAIIEDVSARPGQGVVSMFGFGRSLGVIVGAVAALGLEPHYIRPQHWQAIFKLRGKGKEGSRKMAAHLWPDWKETFARKRDDGRAEAALIALSLVYATRKQEKEKDSAG